MSNVNFLKNYFDKNKTQLLDDFFTFLRFESISTDSAYKSQVLDCANWLAKYIKDSGMQVELWDTVRYPVIFAEWKDTSKDLPTVLIYFHYDVQPIDPIELWTSPPFEPTLRDGEIYARGAMDDKGQAFYVIAALKALLEKDGRLPVNVKLCIEGEEECGSQGIKSVLEQKASQLRADHFFVVDLGIHAMDKPAVTLGIRGICTFSVELKGSSTDLHSGTHGGVAYNPLHALVDILAKMRAPDGKILIPGFYDDVETLTKEEKSQLDLSFDLEEYKQFFGGLPNGGEKSFSPIESSWLRPTLEVNGIGGGYSGEGFKTVIPAKASAKISCRLVPNMNPDKISKSVIDFIKSNVPEGMEVNIHADGQGAALRTPLDTPGVKAVKQAFEEVTKHTTSYILSGGSIPIAEKLANAASAKTVLFGYGLPGDNLHAPNEHFGVERIKLGMATVGRALEIIGQK